VLHEQLAAREEERQLAAEALMAERAAMAAQARTRPPRPATLGRVVSSSSVFTLIRLATLAMPLRLPPAGQVLDFAGRSPAASLLFIAPVLVWERPAA